VKPEDELITYTSVNGNKARTKFAPRTNVQAMMAYAKGEFKLLTGQPGQIRDLGDEVFLTTADRLDRIPARASSDEVEELRAAALRRFYLNAWLYDNDRVLPRSVNPAAAVR